ncbi:MAG: polysaccharide biosynthesis C-terminal domain-containing protein [Arcobacter sp.]
MLAPISQTIYPYISNLASKSKKEAIKFIREIVGGLSFALSTILFIFAKVMVHLLAGNKYENSILILKILSFLPFVIGLSNVFGNGFLLNFNLKDYYFYAAFIGCIINILLALILVPFIGAIGTAVSILLAEAFVTAYVIVIFMIRSNVYYEECN